MPKNIDRQKIIEEFLLTQRQTAQLFLKGVHTALENKPEIHYSLLILLNVIDQCGPQTQKEIAHKLYHSEAAISRQVSLALEKGLITTTVDPRDRRISIISLTNQGNDVLKKVKLCVAEYFYELLTPLPDHQLQDLIKNSEQLQQLLIHKQDKDHHA